MCCTPGTPLECSVGSVSTGDRSKETWRLSLDILIFTLDWCSFCLCVCVRDKPNVMYFDIIKCVTGTNIMAAALQGLQCPTTQVCTTTESIKNTISKVTYRAFRRFVLWVLWVHTHPGKQTHDCWDFNSKTVCVCCVVGLCEVVSLWFLGFITGRLSARSKSSQFLQTRVLRALISTEGHKTCKFGSLMKYQTHVYMSVKCSFFCFHRHLWRL